MGCTSLVWLFITFSSNKIREKCLLCNQMHLVQCLPIVTIFDFFSIRSQYFFVCLCVCLGFIIPLENFSRIWKITITGEVLQTLTNARHSWPLRSQDFLTCRYYFDTGQPFIMVISDPWHSRLLLNVWQCSNDYLGLSRSVIEPRSLACETNALPLHQQGDICKK